MRCSASAWEKASKGVQTIAAELGYESPSAFVYMFRSTLGFTPGRYDPRMEGRCAARS